MNEVFQEARERGSGKERKVRADFEEVTMEAR